MPTLIELDGSVNITVPRVAVDLAGNATAVWTSWNGTTFDLLANRLSPGVGWGTPVSIKTAPGNAGDHAVVADSLGKAIAIWTHYNETSYDIYANRFVPGEGWGISGPIEQGSGNAGEPHLATNNAGNAIAVWIQFDGMHGSVFASRLTTGGSWDTPEPIEASTREMHGPQVAIDGTGNAVALWWDFDGAAANLWSNRYVAGVGWETAAVLKWAAHPFDAQATIAVDPGGNATAIWRQATGVWSSRFMPGSGWAPPGLVGSASAGTYEPRVAAGPGGDAIAIWAQDAGASRDIYANRYVPGVGWGTPRLVETTPGLAGFLDLAMDRRGNAIATWSQQDGQPYYIFAARYVADIGWQSPVRVSVGVCNAFDPSIAMDGAGNAVAVWAECDGVRFNAWARRYVVGDGAPHLTLTSPARALTNDATVTVAGATDPGVSVTIDGAAVAVDRDGTFSRTLTLPDGPHTFVVVAENLAGNTRTARATVTVDTTPPTLALASPADRTIVEVPTVTVSGTTDPGALVLVGGVVADIGPNGTFSVRVPLMPGENESDITATDAAGNSATSRVHVTFANPILGLRDQVSLLLDLLAVSLAVAGASLVLWWRSRPKREDEEPEIGTHGSGRE